jgi:hypothetical protein
MFNALYFFHNTAGLDAITHKSLLGNRKAA